MKKIISTILAMLLFVSNVAVYADSDASNAMQTALVAVKQKIVIPDELSEFSSSSREYNGILNYSFNWNDEYGKKNISVDCDYMGRISRYYYYDEALYTDALFTDITEAEIINFADSFIRKIAPESFADENDTLVLDEDSISGGGLTYYVSYERYRNGNRVKDNRSSVTVRICNEKMYVRDVNIGYDYVAEFEEPKAEITNYKEKYTEAFPIELIYRNKDRYKYVPHNLDEKQEIILEYRIKDNSPGYISAETGSIVKEDVRIYASGGGSNKNEAMQDSAASPESFLTEKELEELDNIKGLLSKDEIKSFLKELPHVGFEDDMQTESFRITKDNKDDYYISARYDNKKDDKLSRRISIRLNGMNGKLYSLSNYSYYNTDENIASSAQKEKTESNIQNFIDKVAKDEYENFKEKSSEWYKNELSKNYVRLVNDIEYIDNTMYIGYDAYTERIESYSLNYDNELEFVSPEGALTAAEASEAMYKTAPIEKIYVVSDKKYKLCYAVSEFGVELDAFTGERIKSPYEKNEHKYNYSDMDSHWGKEAVRKLASIGIGLDGDKFNPDSPITQLDLLRLFAAGVHYNSYLDYSEDELYERLADLNVISEGERAPETNVKREDAFVYLIRFSKLEALAKAEDIFKVSYADGELIGKGKLGYAAILTGLDVICGSGGYIRPDENITRAETASMLYKYLLKMK